MIPKVIHYCWFGGSPLPDAAIKCIDSWKKYFPNYTIKEWNEHNFNVNIIPYTREAYSVKKYAFVSDFARFWILYKEGGLYFDTDVEVIASFDDIVEKGAFMGVESPSVNGTLPLVNPGLAFGAEPSNIVVKSILDHYSNLHYHDSKGNRYPDTVVTQTTLVLSKLYNLSPINSIQRLDGITIYPVDFFNPFNDLTGVLKTTDNSRSIHWFAKSWQDVPMWYFKITRILHRIFGINALKPIKSTFGLTKE